MNATRTCSVKDCSRSRHANSYCVTHDRHRSQGKALAPIKGRLPAGIPLPERVDFLTDKAGECWEWTGWKRAGYGMLYANGEKRTAHRVAYEIEYGEVPEGLDVDHKCRNRGCVRPSHLHAVTRSENMQNITAQRNNSSGYRGVSKSIGRTGKVKWGAKATVQGRSYSGGYHDTPEAANEAVIQLRNRVQENNRQDWE